MLLISGRRDLGSSQHLQILDQLDEASTVVTCETPPFQFSILDTPNIEIARATTLLAIALESFKRAMTNSSLDELKEAEKTFQKAFPLPAALEAESERLSKILPIQRIIQTIFEAMEYVEMNRPPHTLTLAQHKELARVVSKIYYMIPRDINGWSKSALLWINKQTMRNFAHHIHTTLDVEKMTCRTTATRLLEIANLLEVSGFKEDGIYADITSRLDAGYKFEVGDYKLRHVEDVLSGRIYKAASNSP